MDYIHSYIHLYDIIHIIFINFFIFFFFNDTATTEIYTLSLHDALPIYRLPISARQQPAFRWHRLPQLRIPSLPSWPRARHRNRSEEHTSELQSQFHLVCRLLLEKKKIKQKTHSS